MQRWSTHRTVVEEPDAEASVEKLKRRFDRFSDQWEGLKWLLARKPNDIALKATLEGTVYCLAHRKGHEVFGIPEIAVLYKYDDNEVVVFDVMAWDPFKDEE